LNKRELAARRTTRGSSTERRRENKTRVSGNVSTGSSMGRGKFKKREKRERKEED